MREEEQSELEQSIKGLQKKVVDQITKESEQLMQELLQISYDRDLDARVRLQAIGMLLDRSLPRIGVSHTEPEEAEESNTAKRMRAEIEELVKKQDQG